MEKQKNTAEENDETKQYVAQSLPEIPEKNDFQLVINNVSKKKVLKF